jgi:hypothetical protein
LIKQHHGSGVTLERTLHERDEDGKGFVTGKRPRIERAGLEYRLKAAFSSLKEEPPAAKPP